MTPRDWLPAVLVPKAVAPGPEPALLGDAGSGAPQTPFRLCQQFCRRLCRQTDGQLEGGREAGGGRRDRTALLASYSEQLSRPQLPRRRVPCTPGSHSQ